MLWASSLHSDSRYLRAKLAKDHILVLSLYAWHPVRSSTKNEHTFSLAAELTFFVSSEDFGWEWASVLLLSYSTNSGSRNLQPGLQNLPKEMQDTLLLRISKWQHWIVKPSIGSSEHRALYNCSQMVLTAAIVNALRGEQNTPPQLTLKWNSRVPAVIQFLHCDYSINNIHEVSFSQQECQCHSRHKFLLRPWLWWPTLSGLPRALPVLTMKLICSGNPSSSG